MNKINLPKFFIIGSARSGTTALYNNLVQHPEIYMPQRKELHFFSHGWHKGLNWYYSHFEKYKGEKTIGEFIAYVKDIRLPLLKIFVKF